MTYGALFLVAIGLSMDAFAAALSKGLCVQKVTFKEAGKIGLFFGMFQGVMPVIGWFLGKQFAVYIEAFDHWIALILLAFIGGKMLYDAFTAQSEEEDCTLRISVKELVVLSVATSIDALAVGVTLAFLHTTISIFSAAGIIGCTTLILSVAGVYIGKGFGMKYKKRAEIMGGVVLIAIGMKIFVEHMFF